MNNLNTWRDVQKLTRHQFRETGGCLWPSKSNSPGNSFRIPNGTPFQIRIEGPTSRFRMIPGECRDGRFRVLKGPASGDYSSANEAVSNTRSDVAASNAYLYIEFKVDGYWMLADDIRYRDDLCWHPTRAEELAMEALREVIEKKARAKKKHMTSNDIEILCEKLLDENPKALEIGERRAEEEGKL